MGPKMQESAPSSIWSRSEDNNMHKHTQYFGTNVA
jgi:hypothetical protein